MVLGQFPNGYFLDGLFPDRQFPEGISPKDSFPKGSSPNGQFPGRTFPRRTVPRITFLRTEISPSRHFPESQFLIIQIFICRWDIKVAEANEFQQNSIGGLLNCWTPLEITSWKFFVSFLAPLRNLVRSEQ